MRRWIEQHETQNQRLDPTGIANLGDNCGLMGPGPDLDC